MVSSNKSIEHIAGGLMLGSFATFCVEGKGNGCCNSGKRNSEELGQQSMISEDANKIIFNNLDESPKKKEVEKIVYRYINKPVVQYKDKIVEKDRIVEKEVRLPLAGTIDFGNGKVICRNKIFLDYIDLIKETTGEQDINPDIYTSNADIVNIYKSYKDSLNKNLDFEKVKTILNDIQKEELEIWKDFYSLFTTQYERNENEIKVKDFLTGINNIIYLVLLSTYEKTMMVLFNNYTYVAKENEYNEATGELINTKEENVTVKNICTCVNVSKRFNPIYSVWKSVEFLTEVKDYFFTECKYLLDLNKILLDFYRAERSRKKNDLNLEKLSSLLNLRNIDCTQPVVEGADKKIFKSLIFSIRFTTMQIFIDFVVGLNNKILEKFDFLVNLESKLTNTNLNLAIHPTDKLSDVLINTERNSDNFVKDIIFEDFNEIKRIYDSLCFVKNELFRKTSDKIVYVLGYQEGQYSSRRISSLSKLYEAISDGNGSLSSFLKFNVFNLPLTTKDKKEPLYNFLKTDIDPNSFIETNKYTKSEIKKVFYKDKVM